MRSGSLTELHLSRCHKFASLKSNAAIPRTPTRCQMTLVTIGFLTINLDNVAFWVVRPATQGSTPSSPDQPVIVIHFVGNSEPISLYPPLGAMFLSFASANLNIKSV
jgi:hypothetical protein